MAEVPSVDSLVKEAVKRCRERIKSGEKSRPPETTVGRTLRRKWL